VVAGEVCDAGGGGVCFAGGAGVLVAAKQVAGCRSKLLP